MQDATVDRLTKVLSDPRPDNGSRKKHPSKGLLPRLQLEEGWFSFFLLALVVYSTIWCVQAVGWVDHLSLLSLVTAVGLIFGIIASKQKRLPALLVHVLAVVLSILLAFWQTSASYYGGHLSALFTGMRIWFSLALNGGTSSDQSIFLFFILALGFLLAYTSTWLFYRTRSPWLMLLANAIILLINLNNVDAAYVVFLLLFLIAALLLLLRFNLYESSLRWKRLGLRRSEELNWEFMQAGVLISLAMLVASWLLPWGYTNQQAAQIWNANNNPWVQAQNVWNRLLSVSGGTTAQNHGNFTNLLTLSGNPNLTNTPVFQVKTTDGSQYLQAASYDLYDGQRNWSNSLQSTLANGANITYYDGSLDLRAVTQTITVVNPPGEQSAYLFGASQLAATNQGTQVLSNKSDGSVTAWLRANGKLAAGNVYTATSYVSNADIQTLNQVPLPVDGPALSSNGDGPVPPTYFNPAIVTTYTQLPPSLDPRIRKLAEQITTNISTMYSKVAALELYLRTNYTYDSTITAPPPGVEAASWFLFQSKRGFCNYFATAMTLMARELGIPARVAVGYTNGQYNNTTGLWNVVGTDAHAWTQVYFAGYGWINFEPSATFAAFARPLTPALSTPGTILSPIAGNKTDTNRLQQELQNQQHGGGSGSDNGSSANGNQVRLDLSLVVLLLIVFILVGGLYFNFWWRRLFRGLSLPSQIYGRVSVLASWAGISSSRTQTPHEYMQTLTTIAPEEAVIFERLGDIYARERWADPHSSDHPSQTGEVTTVAGLWKSLQPRLLRYVLRHPHFLRTLPARSSQALRQLFFKRSSRSASTVIVEEEVA
jgi:transglutaminase-like putative cysteine protease